MALVAVSLVLTLAIAVPLGVVASRSSAVNALAVLLAGALYTIPALALFALLVPIVGLGPVPAIAATVAYSLLLVVRNVSVGLRGVPADILEAADGMGFGRWRRLVRVEFPLAAPVILAGIRLAVVTQVAVATVGAFIGAGGLGDIIFQGIVQDIGEKIVAGAVAASLLAVGADEAIRRLELRFARRAGQPA